MNATHVLCCLALAVPLVAKSPAPVQLVSCVVSGTGLLEAEVSNTSDFELTCTLRCDYAIRGATVSHVFKVSIPPRFRGIAGQVDTASGQPGRYPGAVGACRVR